MKSVFLKIQASHLDCALLVLHMTTNLFVGVVKICEYTFYVNSAFSIVDQSYALIFYYS